MSTNPPQAPTEVSSRALLSRWLEELDKRIASRTKQMESNASIGCYGAAENDKMVVNGMRYARRMMESACSESLETCALQYLFKGDNTPAVPPAAAGSENV